MSNPLLVLRACVAVLAAAGTPAVLAASDTPSGGAESSFPIAATALPEMCLGLAFDGTNYLVGIQGNALNEYAVGAQLVSGTGGLVGPLIATGRDGGVPTVGFDGTDYLLLWHDCGDPCNHDLYGAVTSPAGVVGTPFLISGPFDEIGGVAFDGSNYLVVYFVEVNPPTSNSRVYGRLVSPGGVVGDEIAISTGFGDFGLNNVAFDGTRFLVVWVDDDNDWEVRGRFVDTSGGLGNEFSIDASPAPSDNPVALGFAEGQYLVVWSDEVAAGNWDLFGQRLDTAGNELGGTIDISTAVGGQIGPFLAPGAHGFVVTWTDMRNDLDGDLVCDPGEGTCFDIRARFVTPSGELEGDEVVVNAGAENQWISSVARGGIDFLVTWVTGGQPFDLGGDVHGAFLVDSFIFVDGFESGDTTAWSSTVP